MKGELPGVVPSRHGIVRGFQPWIPRLKTKHTYTNIYLVERNNIDFELQAKTRRTKEGIERDINMATQFQMAKYGPIPRRDDKYHSPH